MICDIKYNYITLVDNKCEFCKCTLIMKLNYYKDTNFVILIYYYVKLIYLPLLEIY